MIVAGVLYVSYLWCARSKIELTATLIEQSIVVLRTHPALFLVAAVLLVLSLIAYVAVLASAYTLLFGDGEWVYEAYTGTCEWAYQPWQWAGFLITIIFALWVFELFFAIRFATVSLGNVAPLPLPLPLPHGPPPRQLPTPAASRASLPRVPSWRSLGVPSLPPNLWPWP